MLITKALNKLDSFQPKCVNYFYCLHINLMFQLLYLPIMLEEVKYTEENIKSLDWKDHIRTRPECISASWRRHLFRRRNLHSLKEIIDNSVMSLLWGLEKKLKLKPISLKFC